MSRTLVPELIPWLATQKDEIREKWLNRLVNHYAWCTIWWGGQETGRWMVIGGGKLNYIHRFSSLSMSRRFSHHHPGSVVRRFDKKTFAKRGNW